MKHMYHGDPLDRHKPPQVEPAYKEKRTAICIFQLFIGSIALQTGNHFDLCRGTGETRSLSFLTCHRIWRVSNGVYTFLYIVIYQFEEKFVISSSLRDEGNKRIDPDNPFSLGCSIASRWNEYLLIIKFSRNIQMKLLLYRHHHH
jgi:hypothetical protein